MGIFELFLIAGSIISLVVAWGLFYENCTLAIYIVNLLNDKIQLTEDLIELQIIKIKLMKEIIILEDANKKPKLLLEDNDNNNQKNETPKTI